MKRLVTVALTHFVIALLATLIIGVQPASAQRLEKLKLKTTSTTRGLPSEFTKGSLTLQFTNQGGFTLRRSSDGKWLLFPSDTSYISVSIDGNVYVQPHRSEGNLLTFISRQDTPDGPMFTYEVPGLPVRIKVAFVLQTDWMFIRTEVINNDSRHHRVAVRYLLDTQLDENDGAPLFAPGVVDPVTGEIVVTHEVTIPNPPFTAWQAFDDPITRALTTVGTLTQRPVQIAFAHWPVAVHEQWDYTTDPNRRFFTPGFLTTPESDSCVLVWFDNRAIAPGAATTYETAYGLSAKLQPIRLIAPWQIGQWWQPSTYDGHPPQNALDFNKVTNVREQWPWAGEEVDDFREPIRAAHDGLVIFVRKEDSGGYGKYVDIQSSENPDYFTRYAHLDSVDVNQGDHITAGQVIGRCGKTGEIQGGSHLHFELRHKTQGAIPISEIDGQRIEIDFSRKGSLERYLGRPIQSRSRSSTYQEVVNALTRLKQTIRPTAKIWVDEASLIMAEAIVKTRPDVAKEALKIILTLGVGSAAGQFTPAEIHALSWFGGIIKTHNVVWDVFKAIFNAAEQIQPNATVQQANDTLQTSLRAKLEPMVQQAEEALQGATDALPDPLPPSFDTQAVIIRANNASDLIQRASSGSLRMCHVIYLPNREQLILPEGAVYEWKETHKKLLANYRRLGTISEAAWGVGIAAGAVKIGAAAFTSGLSLGGELIVTGVGIGARLVSGATVYLNVSARLVTLINSFRAESAAVADTETLRNFAQKFADWVKSGAPRQHPMVRQPSIGTGSLVLNSLTLPALSIASGGIARGEATATVTNVGGAEETCVVVLNLYWQPPQSNQLSLISAVVSDIVNVSAAGSQTVRIPVEVPPLWGNAPGRIKVVANAAIASGFSTSPIAIEVVAAPSGAPPISPSEATPVVGGTIAESEVREASFSVPADKNNVQFVLSYDIGELDLHIYDAQGRHVGANYQTGEAELRIPGATYTGSARNPEIITIRNAAGQTFTVRVISIFGPSRLSRVIRRQQVGDQGGSTFSVTAITRSVSPALLSVVPGALPITVEPTQTTAAGEFQIVELGGDTGVRNIAATVTDLTNQSGQVIPASAVSVSIDSISIGAGQSVGGRVSINLPSDIPDGIYQGTMKVTGQDASSGANPSIDVPVQLSRMRLGEVRIPHGLSIVALPFTPVNRTADLVFGDLATNRLIVQYASSLGKYVYPNEPEFGEVQIGRGVWVKSAEEIAYLLPSFATLSRVIPLRSGWNLVGNPSTENVTWDVFEIQVRRNGKTSSLDQAKRESWLEDFAWGWQQHSSDPFKGRYVLVYDRNILPGAVGQLEPWKGYWIYAYQDCELVLPPPGQTRSAGSRQRPAGRKGWTITLKARAGDRTGEVVLGATSGSRSLAIGLPPDPPMSGEPLRVIARKEGAPLAVDVRAESRSHQPWEIEVHVPTSEQDTATLWWQDVHRAPRGVNPVLVDLQTGERRFLRTTSSHTFAVSRQGGVYKFRVELLPQGQLLRISQVRVSGGRSQGSYTVSFNVDAGAQVEVNVLSAGRVVRKLASTVTRSAGVQRVSWDGRDGNGVALPAGAYLIEVKAMSTDGQVVRATTPIVLTR